MNVDSPGPPCFAQHGCTSSATGSIYTKNKELLLERETSGCRAGSRSPVLTYHLTLVPALSTGILGLTCDASHMSHWHGPSAPRFPPAQGAAICHALFPSFLTVTLTCILSFSSPATAILNPWVLLARATPKARRASARQGFGRDQDNQDTRQSRHACEARRRDASRNAFKDGGHQWSNTSIAEHVEVFVLGSFLLRLELLQFRLTLHTKGHTHRHTPGRRGVVNSTVGRLWTPQSSAPQERHVVCVCVCVCVCVYVCVCVCVCGKLRAFCRDAVREGVRGARGTGSVGDGIGEGGRHREPLLILPLSWTTRRLWRVGCE